MRQTQRSSFDFEIETIDVRREIFAFRADEEARKKEILVNRIKTLQKTLITSYNDRNYSIDMLKQSRRYQQFLFKFGPTVKNEKNDVFRRSNSFSLELAKRNSI